MIIRRLIVPLTVAVVTLHGGHSLAQGAFPAPLPAQAGTVNDPAFPPVPGQAAAPRQAPLRDDPAFPPVGGVRPGSFPVQGAAPIAGAGAGFEAPPSAQAQAAAQQCQAEFIPLRDDAEKRGKMIKAASDHHAPPAEACKLIENYSQAELKMIKYVEANGTRCGIPKEVPQMLKNNHKGTENLQQKVCAVAQQPQQRPAGPSLSEVLGSSAELPDAATAKKGGTTFNTLNGNVLAR